MDVDRAPSPEVPHAAASVPAPAPAPAVAVGRAVAEGDTASALAATLRGAMHVAFLVLPSVGALRAITAEAVTPAPAILAAVVIAAIYLLGSQRALARGAAGRSSRTDLLLPSRGWVLTLSAAWMGSTFVSAAFVWVAFPLFFLVLFSLGRIAGPLVLWAVALWAVVAPVIAREQWSLGVGEILGPLVGAAFSLIAHAVYRRLLLESDRNRELVVQLRAAQAELADSERRKGIAEERQRLAQDIHDSLAQGLNSIVMLSRGARSAHPSAASEFGRIEDTARENLADARRLVRDLADRAPQTTLEQALRTVISRAEALGVLGEQPRWELRIDGTPRELDPAQVETLHRAAQSLVANVQRHAEAQRCVLTLAWWPDRVSLDVVDDGRGFDSSAATRRGEGEGGDGLRLLRARMERAGGAIAIESAPGEGTTVGLTLPTRAPLAAVRSTPASDSSGPARSTATRSNPTPSHPTPSHPTESHHTEEPGA
ncbi:MAG: histidine kinase [Brachybacterium sp.]|uniref:sensor histidine kinase n=1 Tax=Brachybacterium sp. TaxID=1891286 RepID=UPI003F912C36